MKLSEKALTDFKRAYFLDFGKMPDEKKVEEMAVSLLKFMALIYKPIPKDEDLEKWK